MRFMAMIKSTEASGFPPPELMEAIGAFGEEATRAGVLVDQGGLLPTNLGARIRLSGGKITVTDGPFTEVKEVIGGYAIFRVNSKEDAIEWTTRFMDLHKGWQGWEGETEVRQMMDVPEGAPGG